MEVMLDLKAKTLVKELRDLVLLGDDYCISLKEAKSYKLECGELRNKVNRLSKMLNTLICSINSAHTSLYLRPLNSMVAQLKDHYKVVKAIVHKCKHPNLLYRFLIKSCSAAHFPELFHVLDDSISDIEWLVNLYEPQSRAIGSPANKKSFKFLVWSCIATIQMGLELDCRVQAAKFLILLAREKDEYKNVIFEEGGVPSLQKLLKEKSPVAQITAANALCVLANEQEREAIIMNAMISTIMDRLSRKSTVREQIQAANLVASIAEQNPEVKEYHLIRENVIWRLVTLLSPKEEQSTLELKISCSKALWMLARDSVSNCRTLTETKGMLCLAKLVETEEDELRRNCLMTIREITAIAESNYDLRHSAFKINSPAAKAVIDELLRVIKEFDDAKLRIPAIKSIGSLARCFSAKETRVISPLVTQLENTDQEIAMEAMIALQKFVGKDNHLCSKHSDSIIEFNGVPMLMKLLDHGNKKLQQHGIALICDLAKHGSNSNVLIEDGVLITLKTTGCKVAREHPELEQLVSKAISELESNCAAKHQQLDNSPKDRVKEFISREQSEVVVHFVPGKLLLSLKGLVNLQGNSKTWATVMRCKKILLKARRSLQTKKIQVQVHLKLQQFLKAKCGELAPRWKIDYPGERLVMKEIVQKLRPLVDKFVQSLEKKEIRKKIGYIIHKFCKRKTL